MVATAIALISLCSVFLAHAVPVNVLVSRPTHHVQRSAHVHQGSKPQLHGSGVEGDMLFPRGVNPKSSTRGVAIYGNKQWPYGVIPYDMSDITDIDDQDLILEAMSTLMYDVGTLIPNSDQRLACVYFRPRTDDDDVYLKIQYGNGCSAHVGYMTYPQATMTLEKNQGPNEVGCFYTQIIQHELMHVLGFYHEQSRPDRDNYLQTYLENVEDNMKHNFDKYVWGSSVLNQGTPYDYASIMHYDETAFSMNGKETMVPRQNGATIGDARQLSPIDIAEVRHYYQCDA